MFLPLKIKSLTYDWLMRANLLPKFIWLFFRRNISNSLEFILSFVWRIDSSILKSITVYLVKILPTQQPTLFPLFLSFVIISVRHTGKHIFLVISSNCIMEMIYILQTSTQFQALKFILIKRPQSYKDVSVTLLFNKGRTGFI